ncbi:sulfhydrogenase subunit beta (sulfur reductase) [Desulfarculales bacterium]
MSHKILAKNKLDAFLQGLCRDQDLFAPVMKDGKVGWAPVTTAAEALWEFSNSELSPKNFFFPQTECMMHFNNVQGDPEGMIMQATAPLNKPRMLLNIRPCDAHAFQILDMIFVQDEMTNDLYWRDKREKTTLIGLACNNPCPTCFCITVGSNPHGTTGLDVLLTDIGDKLVAEYLTAKGKSLLKKLPEVTQQDLLQAGELKKAAEAQIRSGVAVDKISAREVMELYDAPLWDRVVESCLNCGTCTFCCPTCHCFDIQDEAQGEAGRRVRNWDSCMSWLFTMHGTGHNPRSTKKDRVRQRFMHKFKYIPVKRGGEIGCVGCGRCVQLCPVNIDVRKVVNDMNA